MSKPPVYDYSDDPEGFAAHIKREMAKPCVHCDTVALVDERQERNLFGGRPFTVLVCGACGIRRASYIPR